MSGDDRAGPFKNRVTDEELLSYIQENEVVTTKEVAEHFDYHIQTARRRLKKLNQEGKVNQKDVSKRFIWWIP